ncbi:hypothetical protein [Entomospira culicis]|uniref:Uncharacterized protein n=1 Tax=Entomospira culicis TaxID=2719989 RepID=A0A968GFB9_9SPIO|nr:hypothetical protein [Entomospira culicis]NIZ18576.1 hypothetical protein [Entomospira culicis]NIZ68791.1 hypothetical protein [Entomospira culicis]WDI37387.1 hypothetical protein PVA46_00955 [Entomospira culicis]WDI39016.1 hypothetical protein PVA47_00965 [Entomospira culicis]
MQKILRISLLITLMHLLLIPAFAQQQESTIDITLHQYLRGLRTQRITSFIANARFIRDGDTTRAFHQNAQGLRLTLTGDHQSQAIHTITLCLDNPQHPTKSDRWLRTLSATLAILIPQSSEVDRLLVIERTISNETATFHQLSLQSNWQPCGKAITITL